MTYTRNFQILSREGAQLLFFQPEIIIWSCLNWVFVPLVIYESQKWQNWQTHIKILSKNNKVRNHQGTCRDAPFTRPQIVTCFGCYRKKVSLSSASVTIELFEQKVQCAVCARFRERKKKKHIKFFCSFCAFVAFKHIKWIEEGKTEKKNWQSSRLQCKLLSLNCK